MRRHLMGLHGSR